MKGQLKTSTLGLMLVIPLILIFIFARIVTSTDTKAPRAIHGVLDLCNWNFQQDGIIKLNGEWEFYWRQLLTYHDFQANNNKAEFVKVPNVWNTYHHNGHFLPGQGYATYRLKIKLRDLDSQMGLKLSTMSTSYRLMINDEKMTDNGKVGISPENYSPQYRPNVVFFKPNNSKEIEIIVQITNFTYARGGFWSPIYLGTEAQVITLQSENRQRESFLIGVLFIMALYHIAIFGLQRRYRFHAELYFVFIMLLFILRIISSGEYAILQFYPGLDIKWLVFLKYATIYWCVPALALFMRKLYPEEYSPIMGTIVFAIAAVLTLIALATPIGFYTQYTLWIEIISLATGLYYLYAAWLAAIRKRTGALLLFSTIIFASGAFILEALYNWNIFHTRYDENVFPIVGLVFIFVQSFILAQRSSTAFANVDSLSKKLLSLDKLKDEFLANTSHELRTPLHGIINITESILQNAATSLPPQHQKNLALVIASGKRLAYLVNDILDYEKLKHGDIQLYKKPVNVRPVVAMVLEVSKYIAFAKPVCFNNTIPPDLPGILADEERFTQIVYNLLGNAVKFTTAGTITISARQIDEFIEISVSDTGIGIPEEKIVTIFESFEQLNPTSTTDQNGTGLGLSITKHLVESHGGKIWVQSVPGEGSTFTFTMPVSAAESEQPVNPSSSYYYPVSPNPLLEITAENVDHEFIILLVDDDYINLQVLTNILTTEKYGTLTVNDGRAALAVLAQNKMIDLVILDVMLPELSGYELCQKVREEYSLFELPVLMMTAQNSPNGMLTGFAAGANDFVSKPFDSSELKARIKTLLYLKKSVNQAIQAELAFLHAQIKPHFLYNALNTIVSFCWTDAEKAGQLLLALSDYLRGTFNFNNMKSLVSLEEELELVQAYITLEKARFEEKLTCQLEIAVSSDTMVPTMMIQPIVENAIKHGILPKEQGGAVIISVTRQESNIHITVTDDGVGIPPEKLAGILAGSIDKSVGLTNINRRMKRLYGHGIEIISKVNIGTMVGITIPAGKEV
ncbi:MAG TPA: hypothetical protein DDW65_02000 [Firmicutes bacterium]|nr:hypothetical protein [Bacillota bacterium]